MPNMEHSPRDKTGHEDNRYEAARDLPEYLLGAVGEVPIEQVKKKTFQLSNELVMEDVRNCSDYPTTETKVLTDTNVQENDAMVLAISSLLQQFSHVNVRGDFVHGKSSMNLNPDLLPMIDQLRCILIPRWGSGGLSYNLPRNREAFMHYKLLISRSQDPFHLSNTDRRALTYDEWMKTLQMIGSDRYWQTTKPSERCTHLLKEEATYTPAAPKQPLPAVKPNKINQKAPAVKLKTTQPKSSKVVNIEEIVVSSGSSESSDSLVESDNSSAVSNTTDSNFSSSSSVSRGRTSRRQRRRSKRSIVTPPVFEMDGKCSLSDFLVQFETYFQKKYSGNAYDQTQVLSTFLKDDLLKIYEIRGGRRLKYKKMKEELVNYYKEKKIGSRKYWKKRLNEMAPNLDEPYDMFGMRLAEAAKMAYPHDKKESANELRKTYLKCLPASIVTKIQDAERVCKASSGSNKHLPFSAIMNMAKDLQEKTEKTKTVMWASSLNEPTPTTPLPAASKTFVNSNHYSREEDGEKKNFNKKFSKLTKNDHSPNSSYGSNRNQRSSERSPSQNDVYCRFCKRYNHSFSECWRRAKRCLICGGQHHIEDCSKYDKNHRSKSRPRYDTNRPLN